MLLRHRGTLTLFTLLVLAAITVGVAAWTFSRPIDPATASRAQIARSLVLSDLTIEPLEVQQAWVDRLQRELTADALPSDGVGAKLSANYRQQLARNIDTLQVVWFKTRTAQYVQLPQEEREAFLVEQLAVIGSWTKVAALMEAAPIPPDEATSGLIARINHWVQVAQGAERDAMVAAVKDGTLCWLATTSLADRPLGMKRALAMHLAKELDKGASPRGELIRDASRRATLAENAGELVEAYVYCLADQFAQLPRAERTVFVDEQIAAVERWGIGELLASKEQSSQGGASAALALAEHSQRWIKNAPPQDREQVQSFVTSLQQRLVWKKLPAWLRGER